MNESILLFNLKLDCVSRTSRLNESIFEDLLAQLQRLRAGDTDLYWLTVARINELALLCAGTYADNCEFRLVGDLLLNPRRVLIHVRGSLRPVTKVRHMGLTEQFGYVADSPLEVIEWLKRETLREIKEEALLPSLYGVLSGSGRMEKWYLDSVMERETRIAALTGFLACSGFKDGADIHRWMKNAAPADRRMVRSMLCRFDCGIFFEMGEDIRRIGGDHSEGSRFLSGVMVPGDPGRVPDGLWERERRVSG